MHKLSTEAPAQGADLKQDSVRIFDNPQFGSVRTLGTPDNPLFCLTDVCKALNLQQSAVMRRLGDGVTSSHPTLDSLGREQVTTFVNEDGLYDVILDSRKAEAKVFRKWVTSEVLPSIRKTGGYIQTDSTMTDEEIMAKALMIGQATIERQKIKITEQAERIQELEPKANYSDMVLNADGTYTFTQVAKELQMTSAKALIDVLLFHKVVYKQGKTYIPTAKYSTSGYFKTRTITFPHSDGTLGSSAYTVITECGRQWLHFNFGW